MVRDAVEISYQDSAVIRVQHIWNSFLWGHYSQNAKVSIYLQYASRAVM